MATSGRLMWVALGRPLGRCAEELLVPATFRKRVSPTPAWCASACWRLYFGSVSDILAGVVCSGRGVSDGSGLWRQGKKWMLCLCIGMSCMAAGFAARIPMTNNPGSLGIYIAQTMVSRLDSHTGSRLMFQFILLSPCAFLAQNYIILPRLATWLDSEDCLFLPSRIIVRLFVWSDVITFWLQGGGGGLTAAQNSTMANIGYYVSNRNSETPLKR
jgi:hypothetical protein